MANILNFLRVAKIFNFLRTPHILARSPREPGQTLSKVSPVLTFSKVSPPVIVHSAFRGVLTFENLSQLDRVKEPYENAEQRAARLASELVLVLQCVLQCVLVCVAGTCSQKSCLLLNVLCRNDDDVRTMM